MSFNNRPDRPITSPIFVKVVSEGELRKNTVKAFYHTVKENAPENTLSHYDVQNPEGMPEEVLLLHRINEDGHHEYEIPLVRNLTPNELYEVMLNLNTKLTEGDFLFESSTYDEDCCPEGDEILEEYMEPEIFERVSVKLAERLHGRWYTERESAGWRYGSQRLEEDKTHPLMKPWSRLTEEEKQIDYGLPEFFIDLLEEFGYSVISHNELDGIVEQLSKK
jgi:hypothetical protein